MLSQLLFASIVLAIFGPCGILCDENKVTPTAPPVSTTGSLGVLSGLVGTWKGHGFVQISLPAFDPSPSHSFRLLLHNTSETLVFTPIPGGAIADRGALNQFSLNPVVTTQGQHDIFMQGLSYLQTITDATVTSQVLHVETGMWINVPASNTQPNSGVVRMSTIPHGDSLLAQSTAIKLGLVGPIFATANSLPFGNGVGPLGDDVYLDPFLSQPGFPQALFLNPNLILANDIAGQDITNTNRITISTTQLNNAGGVLNIPFVQANANAVSLDAIFWIETVTNPDGSTFQQLQYTQTIILDFLGIHWPHITVATLVKQ